MERILQWILKLEEELDKQGDTVSDDLKVIKEQFQYHEVIEKKKNLAFIEIFCLKEFMINLTQEQNQIGDVLQQGTQLLRSTELHFSTEDKAEIEEQMKILNRRWESLRSKSLDRQTM